MTGNICGNCANFKPKADERFFNCTSARQGGISYGMQVRADTRACEAYSTPTRASTPRPAEPKSKPAAKPAPGAAPATAAKPGDTPPGKRVETGQRPLGLCAWGKTILITAIVIVVALVSWLTYACVSSSGPFSSGPAPTPTVAPTPTPVPIPQYFSVGQWAETSIQRRAVVSTTTVSSYETKLGKYQPPVNAPPGMMFVIVEASIIYKGSSSLATAPGDFVLVDAQGNSYTYNTYQGYDPYPYATLSAAGITTTGGKILYTVPVGTAGMEIHCFLKGDQPVQAMWMLP